MILCDTSVIERYTKEGIWGNATLDALFRKSVRSFPDDIALIDSPDREDFTIGEPQRLTYAQANEAINDLALMFKVFGLKRDDIVAVQMTNTVELPLLALACFRAGLIISIVPPLWRHHEMTMAFEALRPKMLIAQQVNGEFDSLDLIREVAGNSLSVLHVLAFGEEVPDGIVKVEEAIRFAKKNEDDVAAVEVSKQEYSANDIAIVTWNGIEAPDRLPLPRSHNHLISTALSVLLEVGLDAKSSILCPFSLSSLGALGSFFVPWILTGGSLHLHQPLNWAGLKYQIETERPTFIGLPPAAMSQLGAEASDGHLDITDLKAIVCLWNVPGVLTATRQAQSDLLPDITDVFNIGELAILAQRRGEDQDFALLREGDCKFPSSSDNGPTLLTTRLKEDGGELMVSGPMTYDHFYQPDGENEAGFSTLERDMQGFIATGIRCERVETEEGSALKPVWRTNDTVYHGGLAASAPDLDAIFTQYIGIEKVATVSVPDALLGERISATIVPSDTHDFSYDEFKTFLVDQQLSPCKIPAEVIEVEAIAYDKDGEVVRQMPILPSS